MRAITISPFYYPCFTVLKIGDFQPLDVQKQATLNRMYLVKSAFRDWSRKFLVLVKERSGLFLCFLFGFGRRLRGCPAEHERLADATAPPGELEQASVMHDPVDDRGRELVVREYRAPFAGLDVRGGHDAPSLVAARDDLVEQTAPSMSNGT